VASNWSYAWCSLGWAPSIRGCLCRGFFFLCKFYCVLQTWALFIELTLQLWQHCKPKTVNRDSGISVGVVSPASPAQSVPRGTCTAAAGEIMCWGLQFQSHTPYWYAAVSELRWLSRYSGGLSVSSLACLYNGYMRLISRGV
jgi:hypothetical protein